MFQLSANYNKRGYCGALDRVLTSLWVYGFGRENGMSLEKAEYDDGPLPTTVGACN